MANEAYRAVFLRVHPTGKMVLSLTTESDGNEGRYAQLVAGELGVPALDVKVVPADTDRFGEGHGFNTSPSAGTQAAVAGATGRIRAKAQLLAGAALPFGLQAIYLVCLPIAARGGVGDVTSLGYAYLIGAALTSATAKIRDKAQLLASAALGTAPDSLTWQNGAFVAQGDGAGPQTIADIALYAHGTGALPPGVEGGLDAQTVYRD